MSSIVWQIIAENRIQEAFDRGEFDHLPGKGRPLDLSDYFSAPVADRMAFSLLKSAGVLPPELELLREIDALEKAAEKALEEKKRARIREQIQSRRVSFSMSLEHRHQVRRADASLEPPLA